MIKCHNNGKTILVFSATYVSFLLPIFIFSRTPLMVCVCVSVLPHPAVELHQCWITSATAISRNKTNKTKINVIYLYRCIYLFVIFLILGNRYKKMMHDGTVVCISS